MSDYYTSLVGGAAAESGGGAPEPVNDPADDFYGEMTGKAPPVIPEFNADEAAPWVKAMAASFAEDPKARLRYYARERGLPEDRFQVVEDKVARKGDDGKWYWEEAGGRWPQSWTEAGLQAARGVAPSIAPVAGTVGGILSAPLMLSGPAGMAASIGIAAGSEAAGQAAREGIANLVTEQEPSAGRVAMAGAQGGLGQGIGAGMTAWAQRHLAGDIARLGAQPTQQQIADLKAKAAQIGVPLTPAEITGLSSLRAQQKWVGNYPSSQDLMGDFYERRTGNVVDAIQGFLNKISKQDSAEVAGQQGAAAAQKAVADVIKQRAAQASPKYQEAFAMQPLPWSDELETLMKRPSMKKAWNNAQSLAAEREIDLPKVFVTDKDGNLTLDTKVVPDWQTLHYLKLGLDDLLDSAASRDSGMGRTLKGAITNTKDELLSYMDSRNDAYKEARKIYRDASPAINDMQNGLIGIIAETERTGYGKVVQKLFGAGSGPQAIIEAKDALKKADPAAWQDLKRAWMQDAFEKSAKEFASNYGNAPNIAGKFSSAVRGDVPQFRKLRAALEPDEFQAFLDLTDVLKAANRVKPIGSDTEFNRLISEMMKDQAKPMFAKIVGNLNPAELLRNSSDWLTNRSMQANAAKLAEAITDPDAMTKIKELKRLQPGSAMWHAALGQLGLRGVESGANALVSP